MIVHESGAGPELPTIRRVAAGARVSRTIRRCHAESILSSIPSHHRARHGWARRGCALRLYTICLYALGLRQRVDGTADLAAHRPLQRRSSHTRNAATRPLLRVWHGPVVPTGDYLPLPSRRSGLDTHTGPGHDGVGFTIHRIPRCPLREDLSERTRLWIVPGCDRHRGSARIANPAWIRSVLSDPLLPEPAHRRLRKRSPISHRSR